MYTNQNFKYKKSIIILSAAALMCTVAAYVVTLLHFNYSFFGFGIVSILLDIAPSILLILYFTIFHGKQQGTALFPIATACIAAQALWKLICFPLDVLLDVCWMIAISATFILLTVHAIRGLHNKVYTIVATSVGIAYSLLSLASLFFSLIRFIVYGDFPFFYVLYSLFGILYPTGILFLCLALLLFGLNNRLPALIPTSYEKAARNTLAGMPPEEALRYLQDQFNLGIISEEEYKERRAEIIRNL